MVRVNELLPRTLEKSYESFRDLRKSFRSEEFNLVLFIGNPTDTEISWCPDCRTAHVDFMKFTKDYKGLARFHTVPIGSREEFNMSNPFLSSTPHLEAVPTLALYRENVTYLKLVDPTLEDIAYFAKKHKM